MTSVEFTDAPALSDRHDPRRLSCGSPREPKPTSTYIPYCIYQKQTYVNCTPREKLPLITTAIAKIPTTHPPALRSYGMPSSPDAPPNST
ncbi:unnamed protein product [Chondrus crispus]|uniref:Uncharacterized protein n=1 Tax=Chondrus crispus TaxID=2769 RepID=R7QGB1_CHOCR|nr:unnamed protein product [Chondrus crispus]CDF36450.1 unnamed protein product [Chondrus crispus]|eukprot:XP_005716269.1 unnamed protein product [Chondrus crispus]